MKSILQFLESDKKGQTLNIGVIGDAMIDEYYDVKIKRISPECPIPIMHSKEHEPKILPGGAANVVHQFKNFNAKVNLGCLLDYKAKRIFEDARINTDYSVNIAHDISRKRRYYSEHIQVARIDIEKNNYGFNHDDLFLKTESLFDKFVLNDFQAVIFSDYGKGIFNFFKNEYLKKFPITVVDPKNGDLTRWRGCTVLKPNQEEALKLSGKDNVRDAGLYLSELLECSVVITQAAQGISVFEKGGITEIRPTVSPAVAESVIGAGDAFITFLTMAMCRGFSLQESADIAFKAGTLYVLNKHNKPLDRFSIIHSIDSIGAKVINYDEADMLCNRDYKLVFTNGCFDIMHMGHIDCLKFAKSQGDKLVVGLNSDESVSRLKPGRPIMSVKDRASVLAACEYVDYIVVFDDDTPLELIKKISPDVLVKGADYKEEDVVGYGIVPEIKRCPLVEGISTTSIIEKIKKL